MPVVRDTIRVVGEQESGTWWKVGISKEEPLARPPWGVRVR